MGLQRISDKIKSSVVEKVKKNKKNLAFLTSERCCFVLTASSSHFVFYIPAVWLVIYIEISLFPYEFRIYYLETENYKVNVYWVSLKSRVGEKIKAFANKCLKK